MHVACDLTISFAADGNSLAFLGGGWARAEPEFTWCVGAESHLLLPPVKPDNDYILTLDVIPFIHSPDVPDQRLIVSVRDSVVGSAAIRRPTLLAYHLPLRQVAKTEKLLITLQHPDAACPKHLSDIDDSRELAVAVLEAKVYRVLKQPGVMALPAGLMLPSAARAALSAGFCRDMTQWAVAQTGCTMSDFATMFESIGENCEFGLFQRRCNAEPLGLLRFSSTFVRNLIRGLDNSFADLGTPDDIEPSLEGDQPKEYMIHEKKYGLVYHTFIYENERSIAQMREQEAVRLKFLRRKFMEEIAAAEKIFVYRFGGAVSPEEVLPLYLALSRHGPLTMLWVVPEEPDRPVGTIEVLMPNLLKGYIDRFAPTDNAHDLSFDGWLQVCTGAILLDRLQRRLTAPAGQSQTPGPDAPA